MNIRDLVKPHIAELEPYQPGKPTEELERELGISGSIKLASNECPIGPSRRALEEMLAAAEDVNRYPEDDCFYLRRDLAAHLDLEEDRLIFGCGSDGILDLVGMCFLGQGDECVYPWPSFAMYPIITAGCGATAVPVPLDAALCADPDAIAAAVSERTRVVFLANPNNPTGTSLGRDGFERLLDAIPERVLVVADEAYLEYVRRPDFPDSIAAQSRRKTLLTLRTFSKAYGLAGLRLGYGVGDAELIGYLARARHPFNVNSLAQAAARGALQDADHLERVLRITHEGMEQLEQGLDGMGVGYAPSDANFLLVEVGDDAAALYQRLLGSGVITRPMAGFGLARHLRVTVGLAQENERFLSALARELRA